MVMQKLVSELKKSLVITKKEQTVLGHADDFIIDPDTGKVAGISVKIPGKKEEMFVNSSSVSGVGTIFLMIESINSLGEKDEIIRLKEILDKDIHIISADVIDEDGRRLGRVRDYSINLKTMRLERLYLTSYIFLKILSRDLMITESDIIKIEKNIIIVKGGRVKSGSKATVSLK